MRQGANNGAPGQVDLKSVVLVSLCVTQQQFRCAHEDVLISGLSIQGRFGRHISPRLVRDAAKCEPRLANGVAIHLQPDCDRHQREGIGQSIADFQIGVVLGEALGRKLKRSDDLACIQVAVYRRGGDGNPQRQ